MIFYYFGYASNMLLKRIRINSPSAQFKTIAELKNYKVGFTGFSEFWHGSPATIIDSEADSVWGVVWEISKEDEDNLTRQEIGYKSINVIVQSPTLDIVSCKCYQKPLPETGDDCLPSLVYKKVIIQGAKEHGLPEWYIKELENIPDNGYKGPINANLGIDL